MMKFAYFLILIAACLVLQSRAYPFPDPDPEPEPDEGDTPADPCADCPALADPIVKPPNPEKCKPDAEVCTKWNEANDGEKVDCKCGVTGEAVTTAEPAGATCDECKAEGETPVKPDPEKCKADSEGCTKWNAANPTETVDCKCGATGGGGDPATTKPEEPKEKCNTEAYCKDAAMNAGIMEGKCTANSIGCKDAAAGVKEKCNCEAMCDAEGSDCLNGDSTMIIDPNVCTMDSVGCKKALATTPDLKCSCKKTETPGGNPAGTTQGGKGDPGNPEVTTGMPGGPEATTAGSTRTTAAQLFVLVSSVLSFLLL